MSGIINKVKEALTHKDSTEPETTNTTHTTHPVNAAEPQTHAPGYTTHTSAMGTNRSSDGPALKTDGPHKSDMLNKADPRVDSDRDHSTNLGANPQGTATTHAYNTRSTGLMGTTGNTDTYTHSTGLTGTSGSHTNTTAPGFGVERGFDGPATRTDGPHGSNLVNKADPRVDSDRDYSRNMGANPYGTATTTTGSGVVHSSHTMGTSGYSGENTANLHSENLGGFGSENVSAFGGGLQDENQRSDRPMTHTNEPHNSNLMNKLDPRVDSDRDNSRNLGANPHGVGITGRQPASTGAGYTEGNTMSSFGHNTTTGGAPYTEGNTMTGHHTTTTGAPYGEGRTMAGHTTTSRAPYTEGTYSEGNTMAGHHTTTGTGHHSTAMHEATGPAPNTAGPHKSDMLNKADPRVDSNLDGSKTYGSNKTFAQQESSSLAHKDPTDAAQVPPSVFQKHAGPPTIEHDDHSHDRTGRHSISHQEGHRGL